MVFLDRYAIKLSIVDKCHLCSVYNKEYCQCLDFKKITFQGQIKYFKVKYDEINQDFYLTFVTSGIILNHISFKTYSEILF